MRVLYLVLFGVVAVTAQSYYATSPGGPYYSYVFDDHSYDYHWDYAPEDYPIDDTRHTDERNCPPGVSEFSKHDIKVTIDDIMQCSKIAYQVESSVSKYDDMQHSYRDDLENFIKYIEHRPLQLERVLEIVALTRKQMEPAVHALHNALNKTSMYEVKYDSIQQEINMTMEKFQRYSRLCELSGCNVHPKPIMANSKGFNMRIRDKEHRYMCISVMDLKNYISEKLNNFIQEYNNTVDEELQEYKSNYETKIEEVKSALKDRALAAFGRTMFDILLFQDELYHFNVTLNIDAGLISHQILNNILELQWKLSVLDKKVESYGSRCGRCKKDPQDEHIEMRSNTRWTGMQLIDELLDDTLDGLKKRARESRYHTLQELDDKIKEAEMIEVLEKHVKLQDKIQDMIVAEQQALHELMKMVPYDKISSMENLLLSTKLSLEFIDSNLQKF